MGGEYVLRSSFGGEITIFVLRLLVCGPLVPETFVCIIVNRNAASPALTTFF